jgi:hypothetical protein
MLKEIRTSRESASERRGTVCLVAICLAMLSAASVFGFPFWNPLERKPSSTWLCTTEML